MKLRCFTFLFLLSGIIRVSAQSPCDAGNDSAFAGSFSLPPNLAAAIKFTVTSPGTLTGISAIPGLPASSANIKMAVYTDNAGVPGTLITSTGVVPFSGPVVTATVTPVAISPGNYHVVGVLDAGAAIGYDATSPLTLYAMSMPFSSSFPANGNGFTTLNGYQVNIWMNITCATSGIAESADAFVVNGFPNPANDNYTLSIHSAVPSQLDIAVVDVCGARVEEVRAQSVAGESQVTLPFNTLSPGMYFIRISDGEKLIYEGKVLKQ